MRQIGCLEISVFVVVASILVSCSTEVVEPPEARNGSIDLRQIDFSSSGPISLGGQWRFFANEWIEPSAFADPASEPSPTGLMTIPGIWVDQPDLISGSAPMVELGIATLALKIHAQGRDEALRKLGIDVQEVASAASFYWVTGSQTHALGAVGKPGASVEDEIPEWLQKVFTLPDLPTEAVLVVHLSNFHHARGGLTGGFVLGEAVVLRDRLEVTRLRDAAVFGLLFIMGLYHLGLFSQRREDRGSLWFGLLMLCIALRQLATSRVLALVLGEPSQLSYALLVKLEYMSLYLAIPTFTWFLSAWIPGGWFQRVAKAMSWVGVGMALHVLLVPAETFSRYVNVSYAMLAFGTPLGVVHIAKPAIGGNREARAFLLGFLPIPICIVCDILRAQGLLGTPYLGGYGLAFFVFAQSYLLATRFSAAFDTAERALAEAREANRVKGEFVANMSHELRTPLNAIVNVPGAMLRDYHPFVVWRCDGCGGAYTDDTPPDEIDPHQLGQSCPDCGAESLRYTEELACDASMTEHAHFLRRIETSARHLLSLVDDLLNFSSMSSSHETISRSALQIGALFDELEGTSSLIARDAGHTLAFSRGREGLHVWADESKLSQVFINLINNACKYTPEGGHIEVSASDEFGEMPNAIVFSVKDTGIGIGPSEFERIFDTFSQVESGHTRAYGGAGLGLSIARRVVEMHGGRIWVESTLGEGSTFFFAIPKQPSQIDADRARAVEMPS